MDWLRKLDIVLTVTALGLATTTYITGEPFLALATLLIADFYFHYRRALKQRKILVS